jgi:hypothetical protein
MGDGSAKPVGLSLAKQVQVLIKKGFAYVLHTMLLKIASLSLRFPA